MKIQTVYEPTPHLKLTEIFEKEDLPQIRAEIERLQFDLRGPELTGTAIEAHVPKKQNLGCWPLDLYNGNGFLSPTITGLKLVYDYLWANRPWKHPLLDTFWKGCTDVSVLMSTYDDGDHYKPHYDQSLFTGLFWFRDAPDAFDGGDLILTDYDLVFPPEDNTGLIFLSNEYHEVTEVKVRTGKRHCFTVFSGNNCGSKKAVLNQSKM